MLNQNILLEMLHSFGDYYEVYDDAGVLLKSNIPENFYENKKMQNDVVFYDDNYYAQYLKKFKVRDKVYYFLFYKNINEVFINLSKDYLTKILNRNMFEIKVSHIIKSQTQFIFAIIDIDDFKNINDSYGHHIGDKVLENIANILSHNIKVGDLVGRWGGDEFVIAMLDIEENVALKRFEDISNKIKDGIYINSIDKYIFPTISVGMINYDFQKNYLQNLKSADELLYLSKEYGKNQITTEPDVKRNDSIKNVA